MGRNMEIKTWQDMVQHVHKVTPWPGANEGCAYQPQTDVWKEFYSILIRKWAYFMSLSMLINVVRLECQKKYIYDT